MRACCALRALPRFAALCGAAAVAPTDATASLTLARLLTTTQTPRKHQNQNSYNPAQLRWERDDRKAALSLDDGLTMIKPKTGVAYQAWPVVHTVLSDAKLQTVSCEEAAKLQRQGWTIVDVRLEGDFARGHAEGAVNVPLYRFVKGNGPWDNAKRIAMAAFAMRATERNPDFAGTGPQCGGGAVSACVCVAG